MVVRNKREGVEDDSVFYFVWVVVPGAKRGYRRGTSCAGKTQSVLGHLELVGFVAISRQVETQRESEVQKSIPA